MVQIQLEEELAAILEKRASEAGLDVQRYLALLVGGPLSPKDPDLAPDELIALIEDASDNEEVPYTGTYSREDIYADHD